jgi:hypothetical protein
MPKPALTSLAAVLSVLAASSCCLPIVPFVAAAGLAGSSAFLWMARPYLLGASVLLVGLGFYQAARAKKCNRRPSGISYGFLWLSSAVVVTSIFFPQVVYLSGGNRTPAGQSPLADLTPQTLDSIRDAFNAAHDDARLVLFLSPT